MCGQYNGLETYLKHDAPDSLFTQCDSHVLMLVIDNSTISKKVFWIFPKYIHLHKTFLQTSEFID